MDFTLQTVFNQFIKDSELKLSSSTKPLFGQDESYDLLLQALGSIAKHNPKLVIDSLMIWRKSHSTTTQSITLILIRALIEIVNRTNMSTHPELSLKLEEMIFNQIQANTPDFFLFSELLGHLSFTRFDSIKRKYISLIDNNLSNEAHLEILLKSMRFLRLRLYPEAHLDETVDFIRYLSDFYRDVFSTSLKAVYAELLIYLLTPLSAVVVAEVNIPDWMKSCDNIYTKSQKMISKGRSHGFLLATAVLCISRRDFFLSKWTGFLETIFQKLKDKGLRSTLMICLSRLLWTYLYRCQEAITTTYTRLDSIFKIIFPGRKVYPTDIPLDPFIFIITFILQKHWEYGMKLVWQLLQGESGLTSIDQISPERVTIALKAFVSYIEITAGGGDIKTKLAFPWEAERMPSGSTYPHAELYQSVSIVNIQKIPLLGQKYAEATGKINSILGKIIRLLDQSYGSYLLTDDRMIGTSNFQSIASSSNSSSMNTLNTLQTSTISSISANTAIIEKSEYFDAIKTILICLPRIYPDGDDGDLIDSLCRYLTHIDPEVAQASQEALLRIATLMPSKQTAIIKALTQFLVNVAAGFTDILERCLRDYVKLCDIWLAHLTKSSLSTTKPEDLDSAPSQSIMLWGKMQEFESTGLLFLCNPSPAIRRQALEILKLSERLYLQLLSNNMDESVHHPYLLKVLQTCGERVLQRHLYDYVYNIQPYFSECRNPQFLLNLAQSDAPPDLHLWSKCFPDIVKLCFEFCPSASHDCVEHVCARLLQLHQSIVAAADPSRTQNATLTSKWSLRQTMPATDEQIERWKFYLMFACCCITTSDQSLKQLQQKSSSSSSRANKSSLKSLSTSQELFQLVMPLITSEKTSIRLGVVMAFGHVNWVVFHDLIDELEPLVKSVLEDMRSRYIRGSVKRVKKLERLRSEITHILYLSADFVKYGQYLNDDQLMLFIINYIRETGAFLSDQEVQTEWDHQMLRYYFCGFVEQFYRSITEITSLNDNTIRYFPFDLRLSLFKLFEEWCGHGQRGLVMRQRESAMTAALMEQVRDIRERAQLTLAMEEQRKALEFASLRAMSCLCKGPIQISTGIGEFSPKQLFEWIEAIFMSNDDRLILIARNAIEALLRYNEHVPEIAETVVNFCYSQPAHLPATKGYFEAFCAVNSLSMQRSRIIAVCLFKLADPSVEIRLKSFELLRSVEERLFGSCISKSHEIAISSPLSPTYRSAQQLISLLLAQTRPELTHELLSELMMRLESTGIGQQRSLINCLLPWLKNVDLTLDDRFGELSQLSYLLLWNTFYLTVNYSQEIEMELELIWAQIARNAKNISTIVQFLVYMGLERRTLIFASHAKKIITYIGRTQMKQKLVEILTNELSPRNMIPVKRSKKGKLEGLNRDLYYQAPLEQFLLDEASRKSAVLSRGQLIMIFLVDFAIEQGQDLKPHLPLVLHVIFVQLDHFNTLARDHARQLLISILHSLQSNPLIIDKLQQLNTSNNSLQELPLNLKQLLIDLLETFPNLRQEWGECTIKWATSCPVRHIACRSLQYFQVLQPRFTSRMLTDCLARLSNTIADPNDDVLGFAVEILRTLRLAALAITEFPQLFWACVACLSTHHVDEYWECIQIFDSCIRQIQSCPEDCLKASLFEFHGILPLIFRGLSHEKLEQLSLNLINYLMMEDNPLPETIISASRDEWVLYTVLANIPTTILSQNDSSLDQQTHLRDFLGRTNHGELQKLMDGIVNKRLRGDEVVRQLSSIFKDLYLPKHELFIYRNLISLLTNHGHDFRQQTLKVLRSLLANTSATTTNLSQLQFNDVEPLLRLLQTADYASDVHLIMDDLLKLCGGFKQLQTIKNLFSIKVSFSNNELSMLKDIDFWKFHESLMHQTRNNLSAVLQAFIQQLKHADQQARRSKDTEADETEPDMIEQSQQMKFETSVMNLDEFGSFDDLIETLQDLDEYFTADQEEAVLNQEEQDDIINNYTDENNTEIEEEEEEESFPLDKILEQISRPSTAQRLSTPMRATTPPMATVIPSILTEELTENNEKIE